MRVAPRSYPAFRRFARLAIWLLAAWLCLAGTCLGPMLVSDAHEQAIGLSIVEELEASDDFQLLGDPEVDAYITQLSLRVIEASPLRRDFPFTFKVVINDQVNAFALPGGHCYVQTGLISAAESESELVGVIAHEVSHVTCGHHRNMIANEFLVNTAQGLVFSEESPAVAVAAAKIASGVGMLSFSRRQESEADRVGAEAMWGAGWDPRGLRDFFARLREMEGSDPGAIERMLRSHPATTDRIAQLDTQITAFPQRGDLLTDTPRFHFIQERVSQLTGH
jgi:predicted Zn-dependent protease